MKLKVLVTTYFTWTEILNYLSDVKELYIKEKISYKEEIFYDDEMDRYKVVLRIEIL